jgi:DNA-binding transcriptional regulator GbsR (MarR family)
MKDVSEPEKRQDSYIAENAFIHSRTNLKPFDMDHETFKKFFEKAEEQFAPFDTEDEPGKRLKEAIKQLVKGLKKTFETYAQAEDIQDALLFASRSAFILLQLPQLYEMDWFDTFAEILDILNLANKRIL